MKLFNFIKKLFSYKSFKTQTVLFDRRIANSMARYMERKGDNVVIFINPNTRIAKAFESEYVGSTEERH